MSSSPASEQDKVVNFTSDQKITYTNDVPIYVADESEEVEFTETKELK